MTDIDLRGDVAIALLWIASDTCATYRRRVREKISEAETSSETQLFSSMKINFSFFNNTILDFYRSCSNC